MCSSVRRASANFESLSARACCQRSVSAGSLNRTCQKKRLNVPPCTVLCCVLLSTPDPTHPKPPQHQMIRTKFREVNVGMGHVDQELYPTSSCVYPVEALYLSLPARCQAQVPDVKTTYRASFVGTATAGTAAKAGAAAAANAESTL